MTKLPRGWKETELSDLFVDPKNHIVDGPFGSRLKASEYVDNGVPILRLQNVDRNLFVDKNIKFVTLQKASELQRHTYEAGDVVVTKLGAPLGKACIVPESFKYGVIVADLVRMRVTHHDVSKKWLTYSINSPQVASQLKKKTKGTTRPRVNLTHVRSLFLFLPPLGEQHRIVEKIEELFSDLDKGVESLKTAQKQLKLYRQAVLKWAFEGKLTEAWREQRKKEGKLESGEELLEGIKAERANSVQYKRLVSIQPLSTEEENELRDLPNGWCWAKLGQLVYVTGGLAKNSRRKNLKTTLPYLRVANVYANRLSLDEVHEIGVQDNEIDKLLLEKNDLLIVEGNGSLDHIGRVAIWRAEIEPCIHQNHVIKARPSERVNGKALLHFLLSHEGREFIRREAGSTSGLYTLSLSKVRNLKIPVASKQEQDKIVEEIEYKLSVCDQLEKSIEDNLQVSEALRQSILKSAFEGTLVPQYPNDESAEKLLDRIKAARENQKPAKKTFRKKELQNAGSK